MAYHGEVLTLLGSGRTCAVSLAWLMFRDKAPPSQLHRKNDATNRKTSSYASSQPRLLNTAASTTKFAALAGMWKLKSSQPCARKPTHPAANPARMAPVAVPVVRFKFSAASTPPAK